MKTVLTSINVCKISNRINTNFVEGVRTLVRLLELRAFFNIQAGGGGGQMPPSPPLCPPRNHILPPRKSPFSLKLYKQTRED
jgi:hypothetical protein